MTTSRAIATPRELHRTALRLAQPHRERGGGGSTQARFFDTFDLDEARRLLLARASRHVDRSVAEDLVQATFIAALENADSFEGRARPTTWLVAILTRKIADHYREGGRRRRLLDSATELAPSAPPDPTETLDHQHYRERLHRGLQTLNARERDLILGAIEDTARAEDSARLGITRSHLRVLWHRAAKKLRAVD